MADEKPKMFIKEHSTATELVIKKNSVIEIIRNPKNNKDFWACKDIVGYISPKAQALIDSLPEDAPLPLEKLQYANCSKDGVNYVATLMVIGDSKKNVRHSGGVELLRKE